MYLLIIFAVLGIIAGIRNGKQSSPFDVGAFVGTLSAIAFAYIVILGIGRFHYNRSHNLNGTDYIDLPISSLSDKEGWNINSGFILGTGGISGGSYAYYVTYGNFSQGLKRLELGTSRYYIKETNSKKPCIEKYWKVDYRKAYKSKWWWNRKAWRDQYMHKNYQEKTIIVPKNTIYKEFKIRN